ncbi:hypothetical protein [Bdellovibrio bacteriovorus]|uniref:hypothetical protein n=1 Tax=Bdellovibrio bacteriovorus TaxID=959 RepID=UPI0002ED8F0E|nr:hypothetical protein [Bdellovibrio bacteriovorus]
MFHLAAGFSPKGGRIDPLSGMSVNLMDVDQWLGALTAELEQDLFVSKSASLNHALAEVMAVARLKLAENAEQAEAVLTSLTFREERGWSFQWNSQQSPEQQRFVYSHFLELVPQGQSSRLLRLDFVWCRVFDCEEDYQHEGFRLLKGLKLSGLEDVLTQMALLKGHKLSSESHLESIRVNVLSEQVCLTI